MTNFQKPSIKVGGVIWSDFSSERNETEGKYTVILSHPQHSAIESGSEAAYSTSQFVDEVTLELGYSNYCKPHAQCCRCCSKDQLRRYS
jgi:hypothetical protein